MKRFICITTALLLLLTAGWIALAQPGAGNSLLASARKALPQVSTNEVNRAINSGLWNSNKTAVAIAIPKPGRSLLFVFLRRINGDFLAVDVSGLEGANFGFLGITPRSGYDRFETTPLKWASREDGLFQIQMRTRAWKSSQRYTAAGTVVIKPDGTCVWQ